MSKKKKVNEKVSVAQCVLKVEETKAKELTLQELERENEIATLNYLVATQKVNEAGIVYNRAKDMEQVTANRFYETRTTYLRMKLYGMKG